MNKIQVHSIPGSGTRFVKKLLDCRGYEQVGEPAKLGSSKGLKYIQTHVTAQLFPFPTVIPLRHPIANQLTLGHRGNFPAQSNSVSGCFHPKVAENTAKNWLALEESLSIANLSDLLFFPVDGPEEGRERLLGALEDICGLFPDIEMNRDVLKSWRPVGSSGDYPESVAYAEGTLDLSRFGHLESAIKFYQACVGV